MDDILKASPGELNLSVGSGFHADFLLDSARTHKSLAKTGDQPRQGSVNDSDSDSELDDEVSPGTEVPAEPVLVHPSARDFISGNVSCRGENIKKGCDAQAFRN